jgi:hypothetical protein
MVCVAKNQKSVLNKSKAEIPDMQAWEGDEAAVEMGRILLTRASSSEVAITPQKNRQ